MTDYDKICRAFVAGEEVKKSWISKVGKNNGGWGGNPPLESAEGTRRMDVVEGKRLRSYERFDLAVRLADGTIIVNGDMGPTMMTRKHQRELRDALRGKGVKSCLIPFSALLGPRIDPLKVRLVATTPDRIVTRERRCTCKRTWCGGPGPHTKEMRDHFLGETLFDAPIGSVFARLVCGLDRNDDPSKRHFFLARLPTGMRPTTVDEALECLRPREAGEGALRQGEWFFVPGAQWLKVPKAEILSGVPIMSDSAEIAREADRWRRDRRHVATHTYYAEDHVYVRGYVRDSEHTHLKLGDGKTWHRVVRNLSEASWGASGDVD